MSDNPTATTEATGAPERIRVVVRAGKADWIGIAYAPNAPQSDAIVEYIEKSAHQKEVERLRQEAFEDAAQVAENNGGGHYMARSCASAIRKYAAARSAMKGEGE